MATFKPGDRVECVDAAGLDGRLNFGGTYIVARVFTQQGSEFVAIDGITKGSEGFYTRRFKLAQEETDTPLFVECVGN